MTGRKAVRSKGCCYTVPPIAPIGLPSSTRIGKPKKKDVKCVIEDSVLARFDAISTGSLGVETNGIARTGNIDVDHEDLSIASVSASGAFWCHSY